MKELIEKIDKLEQLASELKQQIQENSQSNTDGIDWSQMPTDTLIVDDNGRVRYFALVDRGNVYAFPNGATSQTHNKPLALFKVKNPKLAKNQPWSPWFGGSCPVDPNVMVEYVIRNARKPNDQWVTEAALLRWNWVEEFSSGDIIAWRIADKQKGETE